MSSDLHDHLGPYQVTSRLGSGGMGEVFLAYDPRLDRQVAIKRIRADVGLEVEHHSRLLREAKVAASLLHPAIVQVFDLLTLDEVDHIVMEYVPGTTLRRALDAGPLPLADGLRVARAVAGGLAYAHDSGVIHRDLKTENVLLTPEGDAKIADFGIARRQPATGESTGETLTREGVVMGTYRSMSPEQACGDPLDARSDLFSFGVLLYETFTGESPFLAENNARTVRRVLNHRPPPARERAGGVPPSLSELIDHLLEKEPSLRPRDAQEVAERLAALEEGVRLENEATMTAGSTEPAVPARPEVRQRIRTLMLTDLVRSTDLVTRLGDRRAMELNARHDHMARALVARHGGREIDKSDGFLLLFDRPIEAVRCALGYHAALEELSREEGIELGARAGIHLGEVYLRENPPAAVRRGAKPLEVEGIAKATVARVASLAGRGQTLLTRGAFELAQRATADESTGKQPLRWLSHGLYRFQGVDEPMEVCEVGVERRSPLRPPTAIGKAQRVDVRRRRRRVWTAGFIAVVAMIIAAVAALRTQPKLKYVAVLKPEFQGALTGGSVNDEFLVSVIRNELLRALVLLDRISPKTLREVDSVSGSPQEVARAVGADELIAPVITCRAQECSVNLNRVLGDDGTVLRSYLVPVPADDLLTVAKGLAIGLDQVYPGRRHRRETRHLDVTPQDYSAYLEVRHNLRNRSGPLSLSQLQEKVAAIRKRSERFVDAYLLEAEIGEQRFYETRDSAFLDHAIQLLDQAHVVAPGDPDVQFKRLWVEISAGQLEAAEITLSALENLVPGDVRTLDYRARLLARRGEQKKALELHLTAIERQPSWHRLRNYAALAYRVGQIDLARASLEKLFDLSPNNSRGVSLLAEIELTNGDLSRAVDLYRKLQEIFPSPIQLANLGTAHMLLGDYAAAEKALEQAASEAPQNPYFLLNLADVRWLQGHNDDADALYRQVLVLLSGDLSDTDASSLMIRAQAMAQLGDHRAAVATIQEAQRKAPEEAEIAFSAALVFAIVGDKTAALVNTERAIELGYQHRNWFALPWFDGIRANSEFEQILAQAPATGI